MPLSEIEENDIKVMVLLEIEKMFTAISYKYNIKENHEMMHFLLDIESKVKDSLIKVKPGKLKIPR
ncbi:MAG: hypothetical protein AAB336_09785 [Acidobacteriota bacterium]|mgnify:CR=1 FL=1